MLFGYSENFKRVGRERDRENERALESKGILRKLTN
jgi:hypothetical protein